MPTTLSVSGGYTQFLERLEDRLEDAPASFKEQLGPFDDKLDNSIDFLQARVDENDDLVIGDALAQELLSATNEFFPNGDASIALGVDFLLSEPHPSEFPPISEIVDFFEDRGQFPVVFGGDESENPFADLLGLFDDQPSASDLRDRLDDLFPGGQG